MKQRQIYLDNVCGLLIIHMIFICHQPLFCNYTDSAVEFVLKLLSFLWHGFSLRQEWFTKNVQLRKLFDLLSNAYLCHI